VGWALTLTHWLPTLEVHAGLIVFLGLLVYRRWRLAAILLVSMSGSLNLERGRSPGLGGHEFVPRGALLRTVSREQEEVLYFTDGSCRRSLLRGIWWEKCSPSRKRGRHSLD
jgi:hypothetical protein